MANRVWVNNIGCQIVCKCFNRGFLSDLKLKIYILLYTREYCKLLYSYKFLFYFNFNLQYFLFYFCIVSICFWRNRTKSQTSSRLNGTTQSIWKPILIRFKSLFDRFFLFFLKNVKYNNIVYFSFIWLSIFLFLYNKLVKNLTTDQIKNENKYITGIFGMKILLKNISRARRYFRPVHVALKYSKNIFYSLKTFHRDARGKRLNLTRQNFFKVIY